MSQRHATSCTSARTKEEIYSQKGMVSVALTSLTFFWLLNKLQMVDFLKSEIYTIYTKYTIKSEIYTILNFQFILKIIMRSFTIYKHWEI